MTAVKMTRNGQITLPIEVRRSLSLDQGSFLEVSLKGSEIIITPQHMVSTKELREKAREVIAKFQNKTSKLSAEEVEKKVANAIKAVRNQK